MLSEADDLALERGWVRLAETATPGMVRRLQHATTRVLRDVDPRTARARRITGVTLPVIGGGMTMSTPPGEVVEWRAELGRLLDVLEGNGTGLLVTVDEVHAGARDDLRDLAATVQHLVREDREVALAMAGLPSAVSDLLNDDVLTFLRRASRFELGDVALGHVAEALRHSITGSGGAIDDDALEEAAAATGGYPFMIQLVGYHVWRSAQTSLIDLADVREGVAAARTRLGSLVHETSLADLSEVDRTYLIAMAQDEGDSSTGQIARRLGVTPSYASTYRARLIAAGVIEPTGHGRVDFTIPYLREHLREHATRHEMATRSRPTEAGEHP
ncbi:winged helix-turn-helix domain-containing protein [Cellulomonas pakistanensis]|uniref:ATPase AAA n=1 Tax=Cellulomonas pakistanensis TaxID=992287 RepID=A0A919PH26_9CELL|nr:winged helix-turn-helix domain-containing protein [Cellulomonas pakistanensis]GIG38027.1 ATPase AAA [Cellulomonas pakistanensis]